MPGLKQLQLISQTIYFHNKLQAIDSDKKVSPRIEFHIWNAVNGRGEQTFFAIQTPDILAVQFPQIVEKLVHYKRWLWNEDDGL